MLLPLLMNLGMLGTTTSTHDGVDVEKVRKQVKKQARRFRENKQRLREMIEAAFDGTLGNMPLAEEIQALVEPEVIFGERVEIDWKRLEARAAELMEMQAKYERHEAMMRDDEETMMVLH